MDLNDCKRFAIIERLFTNARNTVRNPYHRRFAFVFFQYTIFDHKIVSSGLIDKLSNVTLSVIGTGTIYIILDGNIMIDVFLHINVRAVSNIYLSHFILNHVSNSLDNHIGAGFKSVFKRRHRLCATDIAPPKIITGRNFAFINLIK